MVPTELMAAAVAMLSDALPQLLYFGHKLFTCHLVKVGVHNVLPRMHDTPALTKLGGARYQRSTDILSLLSA
jgi:hypothetical protein